jgi:hypothetical protein
MTPPRTDSTCWTCFLVNKNMGLSITQLSTVRLPYIAACACYRAELRSLPAPQRQQFRVVVLAGLSKRFDQGSDPVLGASRRVARGVCSACRARQRLRVPKIRR